MVMEEVNAEGDLMDEGALKGLVKGDLKDREKEVNAEGDSKDEGADDGLVKGALKDRGKEEEPRKVIGEEVDLI